jgi:hypothetical protein
VDIESIVDYQQQHYPGFIERSTRINFGLLQLLSELSHRYSSIHDAIFPVLKSRGMVGEGTVIITDLDYNQLNYHARKRGFEVKFEQLHGQDAEIYLLNYQENKEKYLFLKANYSVGEIHDYEDTMWIDSVNPIYRRYAKNTEKTMMLLYTGSG